jgi:hypothetical protein
LLKQIEKKDLMYANIIGVKDAADRGRISADLVFVVSVFVNWHSWVKYPVSPKQAGRRKGARK